MSKEILLNFRLKKPISKDFTQWAYKVDTTKDYSIPYQYFS